MNVPAWQPEAFAHARRLMVERHLSGRDITDRRVIEAMLSVPREEFVPVDFRRAAYDDSPLSIGHGQTISQPYTVAFMAQALKLAGHERVLEIGTGSGYGAAVLAKLARHVVTVERLPDLARSAAVRLSKLGFDNVDVLTADGTLGCPEWAPFDGIVATAGAPNLPRPFAEQLCDGGRCVIPIGSTRHEQRLMRYTRRGQELIPEDLGAFAFVPLIGVEGWEDT